MTSSELIKNMEMQMVEDTNFEDDEFASMSIEDIIKASRLLDKIRILMKESQRIN
ncbi:OLC1v1006846C1 [Oldenlandia corymbosa var. corymbosa]|uniref:OLC1v1006846C1 n=1 Tax=Oldenlandia corymbosa var. corymbosa TaxID=529605 RepID=A0AAV1DHY9_OLDCO|nr:OLC1v1006846C1 [Oldenlandia corymbosa var. corymbosa]